MARQMKDSRVEWIGEIPETWDVSRVKYVAEFEPSCDTSHLSENSVITYTPMDCIKNGWFINNTAPMGSVSSSLTPFHNGDIAMAKVTPCFENGNIAIMENLASGYGLGSSELFVFRPVDIDTRYFFYWLQNPMFVQLACSTMTGTGGLKRVSPYFAKNCYVHYPPLAEQHRIADFLDRRCAEIDAVIERTKATIEEYKKLKQAIITEAVTKGVRGPRKMKDSGFEWIGEICDTFSIYRLKHLVSESLMYGANESGIPFEYGLPRYIRITDITLDGRLKDEGKLSLPENTAAPYILKHNDILFARSGATVGKAYIYKQEYGRAAFAGYLIKARINGLVSADYVFYYTQSSLYEEWKKQIFVQATIQNIGADKYNNLPIVLPDLDEQQEIVAYLDEKCSALDNLIAKKTALLTELETYKKSLIYEYVTGKKEVIA